MVQIKLKYNCSRIHTIAFSKRAFKRQILFCLQSFDRQTCARIGKISPEFPVPLSHCSWRSITVQALPEAALNLPFSSTLLIVQTGTVFLEKRCRHTQAQCESKCYKCLFAIAIELLASQIELNIVFIYTTCSCSAMLLILLQRKC
jgi:hypothetical protein